uniref:Tautomerase cis-CaaD-like domain-containing protein n=1 Tax=Panagrolaimus sp. JU765 TaxID=591449 RepID=A0AC34RMD7_9BILA
MPLHQIYHPPGVFTDEEKENLAKNITELYASNGLPKFYAVVLFLPVENQSFFVGGQKTEKFVRILVQHLARHFFSSKSAERFLNAYEKVLEPFIKDKGLDWEVNVTLADRDLWRENGISPPLPNTLAEKEWIKLNKAVVYDEKDNV